ncbi:Alpha-D-kanosaminyltransferase [Rubripirellula tenax]|uniref:Alpha-D-kanosaminyltransferase n=1 Tax=Rubripirellula tenax TaxID=2528015 RepID=A0A5C6EFG2_9BACT|nr:glycosyltransferase family 1 protein [Rubripirellula tenax]TWU47528.1 Alpha-D-kanosaminyltransferase [Rubripirellula tenax]
MADEGRFANQASIPVQISRKPFEGAHSIESLFRTIREYLLSKDIAVAHCESPYFSKGLLNRLRMVWWASRLEGSIFHVTGDIQFVVLGLSRHKSILTIHDLNILNRLKGIRRAVIRLFWFQLPLRKASQVTVISEATKQELLREFPMDEHRIHVIPDCVSPIFQPCPRPFRSECPVILQIGTKQNKNLSRLIKAIEGINCKLHIVGKPQGDLVKELELHNIDHKFSVNLSEQEIYQAYCECDLVAMVSTEEGFGMPIIEAQFVERPVVTSDCSSMPEVAGQGAILVDPLDWKAIRIGISRILDEPELRRKLVDWGRDNRTRFSIEMVSEQYLRVYFSIQEEGFS